MKEILEKCTIEGNIVKLPDTQLDRKTYTEVAKALNLIGGKWKGGKVAGFVFDEDPTELLASIQGGEKRNLQKEYQYFPTPDSIADRLVQLADLTEAHSILEPSAGQGAIVKAIQRHLPGKVVSCCELMPLNRTFLERLPDVQLIGDDFLKLSGHSFDRIIANPPFSKNQDIEHILRMHEVLNDGGKLVTICSKHWQQSNNQKETSFRNWLAANRHTVSEIPAGSFKESKTMIATLILEIYK